MNKRIGLLILFVVVLIYPAYTLFQLEEVLGTSSELDEVQSRLLNYQVSVWVSWVVMVSISVYIKWTQKSNFFFTLTYVILFISFAIYGAYSQQMVSQFDLPSRFRDDHTLGILAAAQNILVAVILTAFLQAAAWWFTRRWHRR